MNGSCSDPFGPCPQPFLCFLWWHPGGLRSGSWGQGLGSELRSQAASPPSGWTAHFPLCFLLRRPSTGLDGDSSCSLSLPARSSLPAHPGEGGVSQISGPAVSNIDSQHPWETGKIFWELDQLHNLWIPVQNEHVRPPA